MHSLRLKYLQYFWKIILFGLSCSSINGNVIGAAVFQHVVLLVWQRHQYRVAVAIDTLATSQCTCFQKNQKSDAGANVVVKL